MLLKTNQVDKKGRDIYANKFTGKTHVLDRMGYHKSNRRSNMPSEIIGRFLIPMHDQVHAGDMRKTLLDVSAKRKVEMQTV